MELFEVKELADRGERAGCEELDGGSGGARRLVGGEADSNGAVWPGGEGVQKREEGVGAEETEGIRKKDVSRVEMWMDSLVDGFVVVVGSGGSGG